MVLAGTGNLSIAPILRYTAPGKFSRLPRRTWCAGSITFHPLQFPCRSSLWPAHLTNQTIFIPKHFSDYPCFLLFHPTETIKNGLQHHQ